MAINRTFQVVSPELLLPYAGQVGTAVGTKKNVLASLEAGQQSQQMANQYSLSQQELAQRRGLAEMGFANDREQRAAMLAANQQDNQRAMAQAEAEAQARLEQEAMQQDRLDQRSSMNADLRARNDAMKGGLYIPDIREGDLQNFSAAVDNQHVFSLAAGGQSTKLLDKFRAGDPQAIDAALQSGRAALNATDQRMLSQAQAALSRSYSDSTLRPQERAAVQAQIAQQIAAIKKRAQLLPDEQQPKSIQEQAQGRVVVVQDPTQPGKTYSAFVDPKGNIKPLHELEREKKPDPNAPKPIDPLKQRTAAAKEYDDAYKTLLKYDDNMNPIPPKKEEIQEYMRQKQEVIDAMHGGGDSQTTTQRPQGGVAGSITQNLWDMLTGGGRQANRTTPTPPTPNPPAAPAKTENTIRFGSTDLKIRHSIPLQSGSSMPIVDVKINGRLLSATPRGDRLALLHTTEDGQIMTLAEMSTPDAGTEEEPILAPDRSAWAELEKVLPKGSWITDGINRYQLQ